MVHFMQWLLPALAKHSSRILFKQFISTAPAPSWVSITYQTFLYDLERSAAYWALTLGVVGLWIMGAEYSDLVHVYALARAGFIPEVLSAKMTPSIVRDLLAKTGGKALVYDPTFAARVVGVPLPHQVIPALASMPPRVVPLPALPEVAPEDIALIFHTSGTTSGIPKPVPETHRWLRSQAQVHWPSIWQCYPDGRALVVNNIGSFANVGSATTISYLSWSGHCLVQTSKPDFEVDEFLAMVNDEGLNSMILYAPWLSKLLTIARGNPVVLTALKGMGQICYTGASINPDNAIWAMEQGIPVAALYATTESAGCLVSPLGVKNVLPAMRVLDGVNCKFIPTKGLDQNDLDGDATQPSEDGQLFDLFLPAEADNCPHLSIRNRPDGHITGDLFEEVQPGLYCFRGRNDEWIRTGKHFGFCDTKSIEDNVLATCADLIQNIVVVGHHRPAVILFAEPSQPIESPEAEDGLKANILERIRTFTERLFEHEQVKSPLQILFANSGSLPRTTEKGNIRRKAVEDEHAEQLEGIYSRLKIW
ncbi:acetyl-CoA synthetase-like protein [Mycena vulgaris]|nr:acetyl-CoA synthetase-like protein [Mycena vulgaris]